MPERVSSDDGYRFGFNGQEKVNEIAGVGNHNTAQFWEYDTRLGRRWNLDPVDQVSISNYTAFADNPIANSDVLGNVVKFANTQYSTNANGKTISKALSKSEIDGIKREWSRAMDLLRANGFGDLADYIESDKITITLKSAIDVQSSAVLENNVLKYNFRGGLKTSSGKMLSPIVVLAHELDHLRDATENPVIHKK